MPSSSQASLPERFPFDSRDKIWPQLRALTSAVEARFVAVEAKGVSYDAEVEKIEELGVEAINNSLTPLVESAIERLGEAPAIFSAISNSSNTIGLGGKQFTIPGEDRWTFAPTAWVTARVNSETEFEGMVCSVDSWEPATGVLVLTSVRVSGSGSYSNWLIEVTAPPNLTTTGITQNDLDDAIAALDAAIDLLLADKADTSAVTSAIDALRTEIIAGAPAALNTLDKLAAAIADNATYSQAVATALAGKAGLAEVDAAVATAMPTYLASATIDGGTF